jgi:hypothetical protein
MNAQKYWISFKDKAGVTFDPLSYFSQRTIDQRQQQGLSLCDSTDFPVSEKYLKTISSLVDSMSYTSRWLNGVAVYCNEATADQIEHLPFVLDIFPMQGQSILAGQYVDSLSKPLVKKQDLLHYQTERLGSLKLKENHLDGSGIRIAVLDAGFPNVDKSPVFEKLRNEKRIISTYDFVSRKENVFAHHWHGEATLSCIVGEYDGVNVGMATGAEVLLARTEKASCEGVFEEENWLAAVEWADKNGANIISSSLGYTAYKYFNTDMNGRKSLISHAATIAAAKGILVVNAIGNDAMNYWYRVSTPGDADSVLTVGGTDPYQDFHINFSSFGPTADGRLKPNVVAPGRTMAASGPSGVKEVFGTSFSTPLVAGFAACVWQKNRTMNNMQIFREIEKSGSLFPYYDYAHGYGIPQASYFTDAAPAIVEPTFDFVIVNDEMKVVLREKYAHVDDEKLLGYEIRRNFYVKTEGKDGRMKKYSVLLAEKKEVYDVSLSDFAPGDKITVHFEGYTNSYEIGSGDK